MVGNDLLAEVEHLRAELEAVSQELEIERAHRNVLHRAVLRLRSIEQDAGNGVGSAHDGADPGAVLSLDGDQAGYKTTQSAQSAQAARSAQSARSAQAAKTGENVYVFDDEDESREAFDEFFATPDPHLEKVRGFLLD